MSHESEGMGEGVLCTGGGVESWSGTMGEGGRGGEEGAKRGCRVGTWIALVCGVE